MLFNLPKGEPATRDHLRLLDAIVVPESVTRYMEKELNLKKMKHQPITVSSDKSIGDAGRQDGYGFGQGDRIASCA